MESQKNEALAFFQTLHYGKDAIFGVIKTIRLPNFYLCFMSSSISFMMDNSTRS